MLPFGYNPKNYGGKVWWNEKNSGMRAIWGTQADYDKHIERGGTWEEYEEIARKRRIALEKIYTPISEEEKNDLNKTR